MSTPNHFRAIKYRQLAEAETDKARAAALHRIAQQAESGGLHFADRTNHSPHGSRLQSVTARTQLRSTNDLPENVRLFCERFFSPEARETI